MKKKYPMLALLIIHLRTNNANEWYSLLSKAERKEIKKEVELLSQNAINPDLSHIKERAMYFAIATFFTH